MCIRDSVRADVNDAYSNDVDAKLSAQSDSGFAAKLFKGFIGTEVDGVLGEQDPIDASIFFTEVNEVDVITLIDDAVEGRTVREALNYVLQSDEWKGWEETEETTTLKTINPRPNSIIRQQIGPWVLGEIKDFYKRKAIRVIEGSDSPEARLYQGRLIELREFVG